MKKQTFKEFIVESLEDFISSTFPKDEPKENDSEESKDKEEHEHTGNCRCKKNAPKPSGSKLFFTLMRQHLGQQ